MKNISIAHTHRLYRKFVGHTVAMAGLLALILDSVAVACGVAIIATYLSLVMGIVGFIVGGVAAVIVDTMIILSCAKLRIAHEKMALIKEKYAQIPDNEKSDAVRQLEQQELYPHERSIPVSTIVLALFVLISCSAGTLFWHKMMESLPVWEGWAFSTLFSVIVSAALICCELFKRIINEIIR